MRKIAGTVCHKQGVMRSAISTSGMTGLNPFLIIHKQKNTEYKHKCN